MKKLTILLIVTFLIAKAKAQTNVYFPMPDSNAIWNTGYFNYFLGQCTKSTYVFTGDTTVNASIYHKLKITRVFYSPTGTACVTTIPMATTTSYAGAIRQDTLQKKVFLLLPNTTSDTLLYDFSLTTGDTVHTYITAFCGNNIIVHSMDSVMVGTNYHKRWNISDGGCVLSGYIIQGVGSSAGLLETLLDFESSNTLECFSQNNQTLYPYYSSTSACAMFTSVKENSSVNTITLSPNPASNQLSISSYALLIKEVKVYNMLGKCVLVAPPLRGGREGLIDVSHLSKGIYFVQIMDETKNIINKKIVLQ